MMPVTAAAYFSLNHAEIPKASTTMNIVRQVGGSVATALFAVVLERQIVTQLGPAAAKAGGSTGVISTTTALPPQVADPVAAAFAHTFWWAVGAILIAFVPTLFLPNHAAAARRGRLMPAPTVPTAAASTGTGADARHRGNARLTAQPDRLLADLTAELSRGGCVAAEEEARELVASAGGDASGAQTLADRRLTGEPLAWITGQATFGDLDVVVHPGVYVPRWQSVELARRAAARLPEDGHAIDLCTGSGAIAAALRAARPAARIVATDCDARAVACARANGVEAYAGDLFAPVPASFRAATDVVVAVVPYVPSTELHLLPRDTLAFEDASHYDGGPAGLALLGRVVTEAPAFLRPGGALLVELGGDQADLLRPELDGSGFCSVETWSDEDGDLRGLEATLG